MHDYHFDVVVVGSGLSGITTALELAKGSQRVALLSKTTLYECNSFYAQGGIAAAIDPTDSLTSHVDDTLVAGAGLCHKNSVRSILESAPLAIDFLLGYEIDFTKDCSNPTGFHLTKEGGHAHRRILHSHDATGKNIMTNLLDHALRDPNISIFENHIAIDLILGNKIDLNPNQCYGLYALNRLSSHVHTFAANNIVLASGGAGKVYLYTTNPDIATGDGIAMAYRAGLDIVNMEFFQFHPTCLFHPKAKSFLISEAVRGEGGILTLANGARFMPNYDPKAELAPRDIVARAIDNEMKRHGLDCVYLDIRHKGYDFITKHFPHIYNTCKNFGIDITTEPIPVVPAAHYTCGGIKVNEHSQTAINGLYAVGECAFTGLHGANRLASNSLLECIVTARKAAAKILNYSLKTNATKLPAWDESQVSNPDEEIIIAHNWDELRRAMWDYVGIVRTNKRLERALHRVNLLKNEIQEYYANFRLSADLIELRNLIVNAELIIRSASMRQESRGLHFSKDYNQLGSLIQDTIINNKLSSI